ncbi:MAG: DUF4097 family beta strand repeat protein [Treponema sp.]|nr:DUF4097 family beta strand repeat protein [Candidatus Treponema caballi]
MRDINKKIMFIMWAVVAVFLVVILTTRKVTIKERSFEYSDDGITINIGSSGSQIIPATAEDFNKTYTFAGSDLRNMEISLVSADVILEPGDGDEIVVAVNGNGWHRENEPIVSYEKKTLSLKTPKDAYKNKTYQGSRIVTVKVPVAASKSFLDAEIATVSGLISTSGISYDTLTAESVSGDIVVADAVRSAECETVSGDVTFETIEPLSDNSRFNSVSGNISLRLPSDSSFNLNWATLSGSVRNGFSSGKAERSGSFSAGNGKPKISMETVSGNIRVTKN